MGVRNALVRCTGEPCGTGGERGGDTGTPTFVTTGGDHDCEADEREDDEPDVGRKGSAVVDGVESALDSEGRATGALNLQSACDCDLECDGTYDCGLRWDPDDA